jgi:acetyl-CoA C-acetyltransferase
MLGYPYTKYMVSVMDVDMAAGLVLCTHRRADELGIPPERRVYLHAATYATDPYYLAEHDSYAWSPAMRAVLGETLTGAATSIDEVAHLDLYSCFASSVNFAADALGLADDRPITVTGGLPFHGGAGSNYVTHSIATMVDVLRADPGSLGLVSGVGMHMTKHVAGVYSTALDARPRRTVVDEARGPAIVASYSVVHERSGAAQWALAICDLPAGDRCYAKVLDADLLAAMEAEEWVGASVDLVDGGAGVNLARA